MRHTTRRMTSRSPGVRAHGQRGAVAMIVGLGLAVLVGFAGLVLDLGRLYINKSELQTAADTCALAAAAELTCTTGTDCLLNAQYSGKFAALKNSSDFQRSAVSIADTDVQFSTSFVSGYASISSGSALPASRYAMCTARSAGIIPWFMKTLGFTTASLVTARAVGSLQPSGGGGFCPGAPIGVCPATSGTYATGDWVVADANGSGGSSALSGTKSTYTSAEIKGTFRWVDWDPSGGGTDEVRDRLAGVTSACGISTASTDIREEGVKQGSKDAWNSRFGIYGPGSGPGTYTAATAPPDRTGYAYPTSGSGKIVVGASAYDDFRAKQAAFAPFQDKTGPGGTYDPQPKGGAVSGSAGTLAQHTTYGTNRRLIATPIISDCTTPGAPITISRFGCFLMLNPMSNGANSDVFLEFRGFADVAGSPCTSAGGPGGPTATGGAVVPTLVQ